MYNAYKHTHTHLHTYINSKYIRWRSQGKQSERYFPQMGPFQEIKEYFYWIITNLMSHESPKTAAKLLAAGLRS